MKLSIQPIVYHRMSQLSGRGMRTVATSSCHQTLLFHQSSYSLTSTVDALASQYGVNAGTAIGGSPLLKHVLNVGAQLLIFLLMSTQWPFSPGIIPTLGHLQHPTHRSNGKLPVMLGNELIFHCRLGVKMASAFFRISRSSREIAFSTALHQLHGFSFEFCRDCSLFVCHRDPLSFGKVYHLALSCLHFFG